MQQKYSIYLTERGIPLSLLNPGSNEIALKDNDALQAIPLLREEGVPNLGGDVLTIAGGELIYVIQFFGKEYHYLSWYCNLKKDEPFMEYCERSYSTAIEAIKNASKILSDKGYPCYVVLVNGKHS